MEFGKDPANAPILEALNMKRGFEAAKPADWDDVRNLISKREDGDGRPFAHIESPN